MARRTEVGLGPGHIVLDGDPSPPKKGETAAPTFRPMYCGKTAGWIKMPFGTEMGLGSGNSVLDGNPAPPKKGHAPQFPAHVCCSQTAGLIKMLLGTKVGLGSGHIVLQGDPASLHKGHSPHPIFGLYLLWPNGRPSQVLLSTFKICENCIKNR